MSHSKQKAMFCDAIASIKTFIDNFDKKMTSVYFFPEVK